MHDESAQGVIEFALIISILLIMFLGTVDFSRFLYYDVAIRTAARVGDEIAINHCGANADCGSAYDTTYDFVLQKTRCEPLPYVSLQPSNLSCAPVVLDQSCAVPPCTVPSPCVLSCPPACSQDMCVSPAYAPGARLLTPSPAPDITVQVGYNFRPISFLMAPFFSTQTCWSGDNTPHTICAAAVGRLS
jgi:TadE-like protein